MNRIIIFLISLLLITACDKNEDPSPAPEPAKAERTVLIYMSGENNLTQNYQDPGVSFLEYDLEEILEGSYKLNSNQHLICFIDSVGKDNKPHIVEMVNGKAKEVYRYDNDFYSSDPAKFREVLQYTIDNYPAKEYAHNEAADRHKEFCYDEVEEVEHAETEHSLVCPHSERKRTSRCKEHADYSHGYRY